MKHNQLYSRLQQGVVSFIALVALVVMSLAAVALIRSVDTATLIAGNLAFKQAATASADAGVESRYSMDGNDTNRPEEQRILGRTPRTPSMCTPPPQDTILA